MVVGQHAGELFGDADGLQSRRHREAVTHESGAIIQARGCVTWRYCDTGRDSARFLYNFSSAVGAFSELARITGGMRADCMPSASSRSMYGPCVAGAQHPDFPVKGVQFKDVTTLLQNPAAFRQAIADMAAPFIDKGIELVAAVESRGVIFGAPVANRLKAGFVPVRKLGKLPYQKIHESYTLEYGAETLEMHTDAI